MHLSRNARFTMPPHLAVGASLVLSSHIRGVDEMERTSNQEHDRLARRPIETQIFIIDPRVLVFISLSSSFGVLSGFTGQDPRFRR